MIRVTQFEFYKIITRKSIGIAMSILIVFLVVYSFWRHPGIMDGSAFYKPYEGPITTEKVKVQIINMIPFGIVPKVDTNMVHFTILCFFLQK